MTKRAFCLILALILPIVMLCGCSGGEPLSKQEYFDKVADNTYTYCRFDTTLATAFYECETNGTPIDNEVIKQKASDAKKALKQIKSLTPPDDYKEYHSKMCDGVDSTLPFLNAAIKKIDKPKNNEEYLQLRDELWKICEECTFFGEWMEFVIFAGKEGEVEMDPDKYAQ